MADLELDYKGLGFYKGYIPGLNIRIRKSNRHPEKVSVSHSS